MYLPRTFGTSKHGSPPKNSAEEVIEHEGLPTQIASILALAVLASQAPCLNPVVQEPEGVLQNHVVFHSKILMFQSEIDVNLHLNVKYPKDAN